METQLDISNTNEAAIPTVHLHLIELLAKVVPWKLPNNPGSCKNDKLLSPNRSQGPTTDNNTYTTH